MAEGTEQTTIQRVQEQPEGKPAHFWDQWIGKQIVIQTKGKTLIKGTFKEFRNTFLFLENTTIIGVKKVAHPKAAMVDRNFISHFHEECEVADKENE
jgi:predicted ATPase